MPMRVPRVQRTSRSCLLLSVESLVKYELVCSGRPLSWFRITSTSTPCWRSATGSLTAKVVNRQSIRLSASGAMSVWAFGTISRSSEVSPMFAMTMLNNGRAVGLTPIFLPLMSASCFRPESVWQVVATGGFWIGAANALTGTLWERAWMRLLAAVTPTSGHICAFGTGQTG